MFAPTTATISCHCEPVYSYGNTTFLILISSKSVDMVKGAVLWLQLLNAGTFMAPKYFAIQSRAKVMALYTTFNSYYSVMCCEEMCDLQWHQCHTPGCQNL